MNEPTPSAAEKRQPNYAPVYAAAMYPGLAEIFKRHGYALAIHGSLARDLDLIAVPWADEVSTVDEVLKAVTTTFAVRAVGEPTTRNHGRIAYTLSVAFGECAVDLSFLSRHSGQAVDRQEWQKRRYPHAKPDSDSWDIYAGETLIVGDLMEDECEKLIFAHNAALGGECRQLQDWLTRYFYKDLAEVADELRKRCDDLSAERQRREQVEGAEHHMEACRSLLNVPNNEVLYQTIKDLQDRLLSAQAAIEKKDAALEHLIKALQSSGYQIHQEQIDAWKLPVDLSLLRERDKELKAAIEWLDGFVVEPEHLPGDGDRQWWQEKRQSIRALAK